MTNFHLFMNPYHNRLPQFRFPWLELDEKYQVPMPFRWIYHRVEHFIVTGVPDVAYVTTGLLSTILDALEFEKAIKKDSYKIIIHRPDEIKL